MYILLGFGVTLTLIIIAMVLVYDEDERNRRKYMKQLERAKVGMTIVRTSKTSVEVCTFSTMQDAIEHPQEITFDPLSCTYYNCETVLLLKCNKEPIEVFDGKEFKTVSDSEILTISDGKNEKYLYLRLKEL